MSLFPSGEGAIQLAGNISELSVQAFTEDVFVKKMHSHNDYWREVPFFSAYMKGIQSIEADIWAFSSEFTSVETRTETTSNKTDKFEETFYPGELYVGHDLYFLNETWTLSNLYLDPIFELLESSNPTYNTDINKDETPHGLFYGDVGATLYLFLDTKKDANTTYSIVKPLLEKFIEKDYLTYYNNTSESWVKRPLTIVLTGNLPVEMVKAEETRYVSMDGHLTWFNQTATPETLKEEAKYSVIASTSYGQLFGGGDSFKTRNFNDTEKNILQTTYNLCKQYGVMSRIWDHVNFPNYIRNEQNKEIIALGADFLNIDYVDIADTF